ncbi:YqcI/YcgG family protein [Micromonospora cathayae]|uniref:YqcI/YcgG family protein n=1 Tax=Micromonospora cathayae TaxID=3028804 RepID=A0ABY7ZHG7_9ACTN|nr:YqcI/YcgG family protein [Micromonospora sp. HUAS 3]WDZ82432.1 YqcI/YcgG family protein [Micromonospora sp. HUAS 3]
MALISQQEISIAGTGWQRSVLDDVGSRLADPGFPCVFSRNAYRKQLLKFVFVAGTTAPDIAHLAGGLTEYVKLSETWDGRLDTAYPLLVAFAADATGARTVEEYHAFGWSVLQRLHAVDPAPWPDRVGTDPDTAAWAMCFAGMPLFCNMSSPAHQVRRSRNLGSRFILVINPRERFDIFAGDTPSGRRTRSNIRNRIDRYDGIPRSPQLGSYGTHALEWRQYGLLEENAERTDRCPFVTGTARPTHDRKGTT